MNLAVELTNVSPVTVLPMQVKKALRDPSVRPGARSCNQLGSGSSLLRESEPTVVLRDFHPALCLPPLDDGVGKRQTQNVPIAPLSARPESWQIVGKWVFERETGKQKK
jgi:hypothetical protein